MHSFEDEKSNRSRLNVLQTDMEAHKFLLRSLESQITKALRKRSYYMKELFKFDADKHSYSMFVMKDLLNYDDLVESKAKFKRMNPSVKPGQPLYAKHLKD